MRFHRNSIKLSILAALILLLMGCAFPFSQSGSKATAETPASNTTASPVRKPNPAKGENLSLADPLTGLKDQPNYHASLAQDITGVIDGKPFERHTKIVLTRSGGQLDYVQEGKSSEGPDTYSRIIAIDQAVYRWESPEEPCQGEEGEPGVSEIVEPARYLLPIHAANQVGQEMVNNIPAVHYRFDQDAFKDASQDSSAVGDLWIAEEGDYIVKYTLSVKGTERSNQEWQNLSQSWSYELKQIAKGENIVLPSSCIEVPLDLPVLKYAQAVARSNGRVTYLTKSTVVQTANFYLEKLTELGWTTQKQALNVEPALPFASTFKKGNRHLSLTIDTGQPDGLEVLLFLSSTEGQAEVTPNAQQQTAPSQPEPTVDWAASGLAGDIPIYETATGLMKVQGSVMFNVVDAPEMVGKYYREQMLVNDWTLQDEMAVSGTIVQIWKKTDRSVTITTGVTDGTTYVVITNQ